MRRIFLAINIMLMFTHCNSDKSNNTLIMIHVNVFDKLESSKFKEKESDYYSMGIELYNNTDSIIRFWMMTCSWQENFISNNDVLSLVNEGCDANYPELIIIKPCEKITYYGIFQLNNKIKILNNFKFKLGFILIKEEEYKQNSNFHEVLNNKLKEKDNTIWSNIFMFNK
jgi:hypothetical protein